MPLKSPPKKSAKRSTVELVLDMQLELFQLKQILKDNGIAVSDSPDDAAPGAPAGGEADA